MTNKIDISPQSGCLDFEAAALGIDPKILKEGREYIQNLINIGFAKPIFEIDETTKIVEINEERDPGETDVSYKQRTTVPERFVGCLLSDPESRTIIVIENATLNMGLFNVSEISDSINDEYFDPKITVSIGSSSSDLVSYFQKIPFLKTITTSEDNPNLILKNIDILIPKIEERNRQYRQNLNSTARGFTERMNTIFNSQK